MADYSDMNAYKTDNDSKNSLQENYDREDVTRKIKILKGLAESLKDSTEVYLSQWEDPKYDIFNYEEDVKKLLKNFSMKRMALAQAIATLKSIGL